MNEVIAFLITHWIASSLLAVLVVAYICVEFLYAESHASIPAKEVVNLINHDNAVILDIRTPEEFIAGHIISSLNIPLAELAGDINKIRKHALKSIIIVCTSGRDSSTPIKILKKEGFQNVFKLIGGIQGWASEGLPLKKGDKQNG